MLFLCSALSGLSFQGKNSREFLVYFGPSRRSEDLTSLRGDSIFRSLVWLKKRKGLTKLEKTNAKWVLVFCFVRDICLCVWETGLGIGFWLRGVQPRTTM